ncbi:hypothetical protein MESS2_1480115 [Mesorhizobium metallidurans STM 2683]|uniref:Uncharacterized protein n=1 Tax=Mesorhizobium metallidurans STM 2683 TaxID=1297569 RepID=M5EJY7_9HYPH|nr:hypothetical protein MESS2_1480115 [Mesorhizobium metallidurans STM 2683]
MGRTTHSGDWSSVFRPEMGGSGLACPFATAYRLNSGLYVEDALMRPWPGESGEGTNAESETEEHSRSGIADS